MLMPGKNTDWAGVTKLHKEKAELRTLLCLGLVICFLNSAFLSPSVIAETADPGKTAVGEPVGKTKEKKEVRQKSDKPPKEKKEKKEKQSKDTSAAENSAPASEKPAAGDKSSAPAKEDRSSGAKVRSKKEKESAKEEKKKRKEEEKKAKEKPKDVSSKEQSKESNAGKGGFKFWSGKKEKGAGATSSDEENSKSKEKGDKDKKGKTDNKERNEKEQAKNKGKDKSKDNIDALKDETKSEDKKKGNKDRGKKEKSRGNGSPVQSRGKSASEVQISQRARVALNDYYDGKAPSVEQYLIDMKAGDKTRSEEAVLFLEAFLHQALDDEANGQGTKGSSSSTRSISPQQAIAARSDIHAAIFRCGASPAALQLVPVLADDMLPGADGAAAFIISEVSGADVIPVYTKLLNRPYASSLLVAAIIKKIGKDNLHQFAPKVKELTTHYRSSIRQSAREAAGALHIEGVVPYDEANSITPWLESQINEISRLKDGQDKLSDIKDLPKPNPVVDAATQYLKGDRKAGLHSIVEKINSLPDDRLLFLQTRDDVFVDYYKVAVRELVSGEYKNAEHICSYLVSPIFEGMRLVAVPKALVAQLSDRGVDQKSFALVDLKNWSDMQKRLSINEQIDFLAPRLRLLKGKSDARSAFSPVNMEAVQVNGEGQPVVNPLVELRKIVRDPSNVPLLFPYLSDKHFSLTAFDSPHGLPRLKSVGDLVGEIINDTVQFQMIPGSFSSRSANEKSDYLAKQEKWCHQHPHATGKELEYAIASSTNDVRAFALQIHRLKEEHDPGLAALLSKRYGEFPEDSANEAELLFEIGGADGVKRAESILKQAPPIVKFETSDGISVRANKQRPEIARFWFTLLLLKEKNSEGLAEAKRISLLSVDKMPQVVRIHLPAFVGAILDGKTPEASSVAGTLVDKFAERLSPEAEQVLDAGKLMFVHATADSYDRLVKWVETEPIRPQVLARMEEWLGLQAASAQNSNTKGRINEIKTKLQEEFASLKAGKPSRLKPAP